jgi:exodeoxyribonuclease-3
VRRFWRTVTTATANKRRSTAVSRRKAWRIVSWNVNGIRACDRKGFRTWLARDRPTILGIQETKCSPDQLDGALRTPDGYATEWGWARKKGYSGVALFSRVRPLRSDCVLGEARFDDEGRMVANEYDAFIVYNVYFPKGSGTARDNSRVPYKLAFYNAVMEHALERRRKTRKPLIIMGDFNTAHREIDLRNARANLANSGFLPEERADLERHLACGFVDTFRHLHPTKIQYSWWSQRTGVREKNIGWRIDYVWVSLELLPHVKEAFICDDIAGSDHCPVGISLSI